MQTIRRKDATSDRPALRTAHRRLPGSVALSALLWSALAVLALWSGVDLLHSARPETSGINSGDLAESSRSHLSVPDLISLIGGLAVLVAVALLLMGLAWSTYALYLLGAVVTIDLAVGGHVSAAPAALLECVAGALLLGRTARTFLGHADDASTSDDASITDDASIARWLESSPPADEVRRPSPGSGVRRPRPAPNRSTG